MQFMSQSMGWADNIILAMAPLGVITAIVGAIRVGGPKWLRAIIGRARESRAAVEADLMSSTSHEVCELWNGQEIVRVMGTGPIREFIILSPKGDTTGGDISVMKLDRPKEPNSGSGKPVEAKTVDGKTEDGMAVDDKPEVGMADDDENEYLEIYSRSTPAHFWPFSLTHARPSAQLPWQIREKVQNYR